MTPTLTLVADHHVAGVSWPADDAPNRSVWRARCCVDRHWRRRSPVLYRGRNAIERMFGRLKDFRRIATRYEAL